MSCPYLSVHDMVYYNNCNLWCNNVQMKSITMCHKINRAMGQVAILFYVRSIFEMNCVHWFILTHRHIIRVCQMSSKSQNGALMVVNPICWAYLLLEFFQGWTGKSQLGLTHLVKTGLNHIEKPTKVGKIGFY